ncbi:MAG: hypothetical protein ACLFQP_12615 [Halothece sp.]
MANIEIQSTKEENNGWSYQVKLNEGGSSYQYNVTLSRSDYEKWSNGQIQPEQVIQAAFDFLRDREPPSAILSQFDCSVIRRYFPEVDKELPKKL